MTPNKVLFSIYTGGYPTESSGGPNNIIYKIIKQSNHPHYKFDYLSSDLFTSRVTGDNLDELKRNMNPKKKAASYFAKRSNIYRMIFGSDFYLPYHFFKKERYLKSFANKIEQYDIIHSQDSVALALLNSNNFKGKRILTVHSKGPLSDEYRNMAHSKFLQQKINTKIIDYEKRSIELADKILFPSKAAKNYFEKSLNISLKQNKVRIIYNGIEFEKIQSINYEDILERYSIEKGNKILLFNVAAHGREKKIDVLLKAVKTIIDKYRKDVLLINAGEGSDTKELLELINKLNIQNYVKFLGKLPNEDIIKLLKVTDIFIMTSEKVIFDLVVLEALATGTCCVVSNDGGNKEIIKDGENGFLIDTHDIDAVAKKIISIIPHKDKVKDNAIKTAKQFTVQKMVNEYFEVYESLLNEV